ncbi:MAG: hypothetical protein ABIA37_03745 [Candidatus Woesearchaeota archaeon]
MVREIFSLNHSSIEKMVDITNTTFVLGLSPLESWAIFKPLVLFIFGMVIYSIFIFKFYLFVSKRDIFKMDLAQYNRSEHPLLNKTLGAILYTLEYILFLPLFTFFWFMVFTLFLVMMSKHDLQTVLLISVAVIAAVRITAYYKEDLSKDLAKMLPFAMLGIFLLDMSYFNMAGAIQNFKQVINLWETLIYYLLFLIILEFILRIGHGFFGVFRKKKK